MPYTEEFVTAILEERTHESQFKIFYLKCEKIQFTFNLL